MIVLAVVLAIMSALSAALAVKVGLSGTRAADRLTRKALPDSLRHGATGGLLTSLENIEGRWTRVVLLVMASIACGVGTWLALQV